MVLERAIDGVRAKPQAAADIRHDKPGAPPDVHHADLMVAEVEGGDGRGGGDVAPALISRTFVMPGEDFDYEVPIVFREDGYINMTKAAKAFGKRLQHFTESPATLEYMQEFEAITGIRCLVAKRGGAKGQAGTWCHPKLAVFFARWLDVRFAVWCDLMIGSARSYCVATTSSRGTFKFPWRCPLKRP